MFLRELNTEQRQAAEITEGSIVIIACAGSGKTRMLTYRIANLISKGVFPKNILALTFTNKAANEMKNRIGKLIGEGAAHDLWMGTFHSVFAKVLRFECEKLGYNEEFSIYDTDDVKKIIRDIIKELDLDDKIYKNSYIQTIISNAKNSLTTFKDYTENNYYLERDTINQIPETGKIYEEYQKRLFKSNAMDFDDLLLNATILFKKHPHTLIKYQNIFKYILIDEYQDTNFAQYILLRQLSNLHQNICVVGDDAQSIYAFRGANINNILNFEKDFPSAKKIFLEQNYRSTKNIVTASNQVIAKNENQFQKNSYTHNPEGEKLSIMICETDRDEAFAVVKSILNIKTRLQRQNSDFAILYRTNAQSRNFEEVLRKFSMKYKIYGGLSFYQRKEIKDCLAYFKVIVNKSDSESLLRILNYPTRGIGHTTIQKISDISKRENVNVFYVLQEMNKFGLDISEKTKNTISDFLSKIFYFSNISHTEDVYDIAKEILDKFKILKDLSSEKDPESIQRLKNVEELLVAIKQFSESKEDFFYKNNSVTLFTNDNEIKSRKLHEFVKEISLITDKEEQSSEEDKRNKISLMTIHAAKGLEFPYVYIVGMEENLFPSQKALQNKSDLEEERRLFYVAITRAEKQVFLSFSEKRYSYGNYVYNEKSRFLKEINENLLEKEQF